MDGKEKVIKGLEICSTGHCEISCPYHNTPQCTWTILSDALALLKEQDEEHRRLLSWLGKFCRHIDNGDEWLTDEENLAFFKEKMKQQYGWNTD